MASWAEHAFQPDDPTAEVPIIARGFGPRSRTNVQVFVDCYYQLHKNEKDDSIAAQVVNDERSKRDFVYCLPERGSARGEVMGRSRAVGRTSKSAFGSSSRNAASTSVSCLFDRGFDQQFTIHRLIHRTAPQAIPLHM